MEKINDQRIRKMSFTAKKDEDEEIQKNILERYFRIKKIYELICQNKQLINLGY